jgi:hypothetical protein
MKLEKKCFYLYQEIKNPEKLERIFDKLFVINDAKKFESLNFSLIYNFFYMDKFFSLLFDYVVLQNFYELC